MIDDEDDAHVFNKPIIAYNASERPAAHEQTLRNAVCFSNTQLTVNTVDKKFSSRFLNGERESVHTDSTAESMAVC